MEEKSFNLAVLASGNGTNFQVLADKVKSRYIRAEIKILIVDKQRAFARKRARKLKIKEVFLDPKKYKNRIQYDKDLAKIIKKNKVELIILAGFMRILSPYFVKTFKGKIINVHPAILPAFKGVNSIQRAFNYGCKLSGVTVHFVDELTDHGPIIFQEPLKIRENSSLLSLEKEIHRLEYKLLPLAVKLISEGKVKIKNRKVKIKQ